MPREPALTPEDQFPREALRESVQKPPEAMALPSGMVFTWNIATAADAITPWGRNVGLRDRQLRDFLPTESFLAGALANVGFRNAAFEWEIRGASTKVEDAVKDIITSAIAGDSFGWTNFVLKFSEDLYTQDNGAFIELIRDPGEDANSKFKNERAPVLGIAHLDANQCTRTGNPEYPVIYTDRRGGNHKLAWYQVIPFSDYPSAIERMNGVGICAESRALRLAQIMRSIFIFKDEKISGRNYKALHMVSGVSRQDLKDILKLGKEDADNMGMTRYIDPAILVSMDPEKPVSTATIDLANLPDGFDFDGEMKWYISGLALCFGVDYQEFAPLPGGGIGSSNQSETLTVRTSGKGPAMFMKIAEAFRNYGVLPRGYEMIFEDLDQQRVLDKQTLKKLFQEEMALGLRNGFLTPDAARKIGIARGIYPESELADIPQGYGEDLLLPKQTIGNTGGNTIAEDAGRTPSGVTEPNAGARLRKEADEDEEKTTLRSIIGKLLGRKEKDAPSVNLTVNNHPGEPAKVEVHPTAMAIPAPLVNVQAGVIPAPQVTLNLAKQATPNVTVNNLVPAPKVEVNIPRKRKEKQRVLRGSDKNIEGTETTFEYEE